MTFPTSLLSTGCFWGAVLLALGALDAATGAESLFSGLYLIPVLR